MKIKIKQEDKNVTAVIEKISMTLNGTSNTTLEYYLNQGMNEDEAKLALRKRQSTFSLEKCIEK
jgi:hypothetical protein